jgi:hypothetical protein
MKTAGAQLAALLLSIGLGKLVGRSNLPSGCTISDGTFTTSTVGWNLETAVYTDSSSIFNGATIGAIVALADKVLGGQSVVYKSRTLSVSDITSVLDNINQGNDDCSPNGRISQNLMEESLPLEAEPIPKSHFAPHAVVGLAIGIIVLASFALALCLSRRSRTLDRLDAKTNKDEADTNKDEVEVTMM